MSLKNSNETIGNRTRDRKDYVTEKKTFQISTLFDIKEMSFTVSQVIIACSLLCVREVCNINVRCLIY